MRSAARRWLSIIQFIVLAGQALRPSGGLIGNATRDVPSITYGDVQSCCSNSHVIFLQKNLFFLLLT